MGRRRSYHRALQIELDEEYFKTLDFSRYNAWQRIQEGDKYKQGTAYRHAIVFYEHAVTVSDEKTLAYILPRITSCYRHMHTPQKAIELFSFAKNKYGEDFITPVLLTSVAAAYCDLYEYENAMRCCRWAFSRFGGERHDELWNVYARIQKETGEK